MTPCIAQRQTVVIVSRWPRTLIVHVLGFDLELLLAAFAHPVMLTLNEGVIVDALSVVIGA